MTYTNMPYYVPQKKDYFKLKIKPIIDPTKDFTINGVNVLEIDINNNTVIVESAVTEPLVAVNKNNPADKVSLTLISTETLPQREFVAGVQSPTDRPPVTPLVKNNVDNVIKKSFKLSKKGTEDLNDELDSDFEEPDEDSNDEIAIMKAKEKGSSIQKLLEMLADL